MKPSPGLVRRVSERERVTVPMLMWAGTDAWRTEAANVQPEEGRFNATGVQVGIVPVPYRLDDVLDTTAAWVNGAGSVDPPMPGGKVTTLNDALDCDLGLLPLSNTMPILRHRLHQQAGVAECTMAWVSVPDLTVHRSLQRYQHLRTAPNGAVVRFAAATAPLTCSSTPTGSWSTTRSWRGASATGDCTPGPPAPGRGLAAGRSGRLRPGRTCGPPRGPWSAFIDFQYFELRDTIRVKNRRIPPFIGNKTSCRTDAAGACDHGGTRWA
jgi:uncharacterized protein